MNKFGFTISNTRTINIDKCNFDLLNQLEKEVQSFKRCMNCGACTATCSAQQFTDYNIRKLQTLYRLGQYDNIKNDLKHCMLCGKCTLVCPRGINLRAVIVNMRQILELNNCKS